MTALRAEIDLAARTHARVLLVGETGVGKGNVARLIHAGSARRTRDFVAVNGGGLSGTLLASALFGHTTGGFTRAYSDKPGLAGRAHRGTLFLDELGELSLAMQTMLLRFIETGEIQPVGTDASVTRVDVRLVTATNRDLHARAHDGAFRADLFYRLNTIAIHIPPLRERGTDVLWLFDRYLRLASERHGVPCPEVHETVRSLLLAYGWPGNVWELKTLTARLVQDASRTLNLNDFPAEMRGTATVSLAPSSRQPRHGVAHLVQAKRFICATRF